MPTNVPRPVFGDNGFVAPSETAILTGVTLDIDAAFGGGLNPQLTTPQGQIASTETAIIGDSNAQFLQFINGVDPAYNSGRMQDAIGRIYFITRIPGTPTVQPCNCVGLAGVILPIGSLGVDPNGILWLSTEEAIIPLSGTITVPFACQNDGPTAGPASLTIFQAVFGWDSVTPTGDAALGNLVESRSQFEARRSLSTAHNSIGSLPSVLGAVLSVAGVLDAYVIDNSTGSPVSVGGITLGANSLYVAALGGLASDVAFAIWTKKAPGCPYYASGNTTVTVVDPSPSYAYPPPSYSVIFEIPPLITFYVLVTMTNSPAVPANALALVQAAIVNAFAGADGGPRAKIGSLVYASRYYNPVFLISAQASVDPTTGAVSYTPGWSSAVVSILVGSTVAATFTGAISGTALTVSSVTGTIAIGNLLVDVTGNIASGTTIISGSGSSWVVSQSQTVTSEAMSSITMVNDVQMNINQAPVTAAAQVNLKLV